MFKRELFLCLIVGTFIFFLSFSEAQAAEFLNTHGDLTITEYTYLTGDKWIKEGDLTVEHTLQIVDETSSLTFEPGHKIEVKDCADCYIITHTDSSIIKADITACDGQCVIVGVCYNDGELNPDNNCEECNFSQSPSSWSNVADGTACTAWGSCESCSYSDTCTESGTGTHTRGTCSAGTCSGSESESCTCTRDTDGTVCGTWGSCTSCTYSSTCDESGTGTHTRDTCSAGTCSGSESESCTCTRDTDGTACRVASGQCDVADTCSSGSCPDGVKAAGEGGCPTCHRCDGTRKTCQPMNDGTQDAEGSNTCSATCRWCKGATCQNVPRSAGDPFNQCSTGSNENNGCRLNACSGEGAYCAFLTSSDGNCPTCYTCKNDGDAGCEPYSNGSYDEDCPACVTCYYDSFLGAYCGSAVYQTDWGERAYGCIGSDKRCHNGGCTDCSAEGGVLASDGCSGCAGYGGNACWYTSNDDILGGSESCAETCSDHGAVCIYGDWNDNSSCDLCQYFFPQAEQCGTTGSDPPPFFQDSTASAFGGPNDLICYYRTGTGNVDCSQTVAGTPDAWAMCACTY